MGRLIIPGDRKLIPSLADKINEEEVVKKSSSQIEFFNLSNPFDDEKYLENGEIDNGVWKFKLKDSVLDTSTHLADENIDLCWQFVSSSVIDVLVASKIGEAMLIDLPCKIREVYKIIKHSFPPGIEGYKAEQYAVDFQEEIICNKLKIVSSYFHDSIRTDSRLPFFQLFRIYCSLEGDKEEPIWREILSRSLVNAHKGDWGNGILYLAMSLESFFDMEFSKVLSENNLISKKCIEYTLLKTDIKTKVHALLGKKLDEKTVNKRYEELNRMIFNIRNKIAHGVVVSTEISKKQYSDAIRSAFSIIWDSAPCKRRYLIPVSSLQSVEELVDEDLKVSCQK